MLRASSITLSVLFIVGLLTTVPFQAQQPGGRGGGGAQSAAGGRAPAIDERTSGMQKRGGDFPIYWGARTRSLLLEIPRPDTGVLLSDGLGPRLGANAKGLDRRHGGQGR